MPLGLDRFTFQLNKIEKLLEHAKLEETPGLWLYLNDLRTPVFMLESLGKLYAEMHNKKRFTTLRIRFKKLEDALGALDYYAAFTKEFSNNPKIPADLITYFQMKTNEKVNLLNRQLKKDDWLNGRRIKKIINKIEDAAWLSEKEETEAIKKYYAQEIKKIKSFAVSTHFKFDNVEADVHELRRKLRWLSIYPQALLGAIRQIPSSSTPRYLNKYITKEILESPYNKFPVNDQLHLYVNLDQNHFFALSWIIAALGKLKDNGLRIKILKEALQQMKLLRDEDNNKAAREFLGPDYPTLDHILTQSSQVAKQFFKENILEKLLVK